MKIRKAALTLSILFCYWLLPGCSSGSLSSISSLQILQHTMNSNTFSAASPQSSATVTGMAQNTSDIPITTATVTVKFYDKDGNLVDSSSASRQNLIAGETWIFAVQSSGPDAWKITRYELSTSAR